MRTRSFLIFLSVLSLGPALALAQESPPSSALQASNILNPNISVIGWFQGEAGHRHVQEDAPSAFEMRELEIAFQAVVDPYARADVFVAVEDGEAELEEGYLTWFALPGGLAVKAGKFKANFGRFNRLHTPETPFADRPLVHATYFGEEGLAGAGGSISWRIPNPWLFLNLDLEAMSPPEAGETPAFEEAKRKNLLTVGRLSAYQDITESVNVSLGGSVAHGPAGQELDPVSNSSTTLNSRLYIADLTFRWKNPRRAIYRSLLWQTEWLWSDRELTTVEDVKSTGLFSHLEFQFARRWRTGARYDWTESPINGSEHDQGGLLYLTFMPSEFSLISLQGRQVKYADGVNETLGFLKITFNIGPHGAHPF